MLFRSDSRNWQIDTIPYTHFRARKDKTTVAAYTSGKVTIQGAGTADLVTFYLEPELLHEARFGYESVVAQVEHPEMFAPHAGIDESGKGDFFGPMVIACVYVDPTSAEALLAAGVQDSKAIKSDQRIHALAATIRKTVQGKFSLIKLSPATYNRMYGSMGNVNRMLAWGHARALENVLELQPDCPRAISDQFGSKTLVLRALLERGRRIELEQRHKAEADIAVAAASILAREGFIDALDKLGGSAGRKLLRGASAEVLRAAAELVRQLGDNALGEYAKLHFRTSQRAIAIAHGRPDPGAGAADDAPADPELPDDAAP